MPFGTCRTAKAAKSFELMQICTSNNLHIFIGYDFTFQPCAFTFHLLPFFPLFPFQLSIISPTFILLEKIKDISKVKPGDFVSLKGKLSVVKAIEPTAQTVRITLDDGTVVEREPGARMEFFRILDKLRL